MARRRRRQFSPEFKAEAVRLVQSTDAPITSLAQQLGVGKSDRRQSVPPGAAGAAGTAVGE